MTELVFDARQPDSCPYSATSDAQVWKPWDPPQHINEGRVQVGSAGAAATPLHFHKRLQALPARSAFSREAGNLCCYVKSPDY